MFLIGFIIMSFTSRITTAAIESKTEQAFNSIIYANELDGNTVVLLMKVYSRMEVMEHKATKLLHYANQS